MTRTFDTSDAVQRRRGIDAATSAMQRGELVVAPVDTSYGLFADAFSASGVAAIRRAKGRPGLSVPVMVARVAAVSGVALVGPDAVDLMRAFWPGGLTLVLPAQPSLAWDVAGPGGHIAVRMPLHPVALEILERTGPLGVVGVEAQAESAGADVAVLLDAGDLPPGPLSSVIDLTGPEPLLLREGQFRHAELAAFCPGLRGSPVAGASAP